MKKITVTLLSVVMVVCLTFGGLSLAMAETDPVKVKVTTYDMQEGLLEESPCWRANAEDEFCLFTDATNLNTGAMNDVILQATMPAAGTVSFADGGTYAQFPVGGNSADGARVRLIHNNTQIYPLASSWEDVPDDKTAVYLKPDPITVAEGDKLYMVFNNGGNFSNAGDTVGYCLGFKLNGNWFGSNEYWYGSAEDGEAEVTYAGVTCKKNELVQYKYGHVTDNLQGTPIDESDLDSFDLGVLVPTRFDTEQNRYVGTENPLCQFEKIGMNVVASVPNVIAMEMTASGIFNIQNSYFKSFGEAAKVEVLKNDSVVFSGTDVGAGNYTSIDSMPAVNVVSGDTIYVRVTSEKGAYLRSVVNGVLATSEGIINYSTLDTVANAGGNCTFYTTKERDAMGEVTDKTLKTVPGVDEDAMIFTAGKWTGREQFCMVWKEGSAIKIHTGGTYSPAIGYEFAQAGKARIANLTVKVESNLSDGVRIRVLKMTAGTAPTYQQLYPLGSEWETVVFQGTNVTDVATEIVPVAAGDRLIVVINQNKTNSNDQTDVKFDIVYQPEGGSVETHNNISEFTAESEAWKYSDMTIASDYSSTVVGQAESRTYIALDKNKMLFEEMTYFATLGKWGIAGRNFLQIENGSLHPGEIYAAAIGIEMPAKGRVDMSDTIFKYDLHTEPDENGDKSDGVRIRIMRNNDVIWPLNGEWQELNDGAEKTFDIPVFEVNEGDMIYVIVDCGAAGKNNFDLTYVSILAHFAEDGSDWTNTFDSKASFVETDANYESFSYWSYYYDVNGGDNPGGDNPGGDNPGDKPGDGEDEPSINVGKKGCGSNIGTHVSALAVSVVALGLVVLSIAKKRS